jgi:hypothetical protein
LADLTIGTGIFFGTTGYTFSIVTDLICATFSISFAGFATPIVADLPIRARGGDVAAAAVIYATSS